MLFHRSTLFTQCEECRLTLDLGRMGACSRCRRVLCHTHLHGGFLRRLLVDLGVGLQPVCVKCRSAAA